MSERSGIALALAVTLLALQGCVGGQGSEEGSGAGKAPDLSADERAYADAVVPKVRAQSDLALSETQARCFADRAVDLVGLDAFRAVGGVEEAASAFARYDLRPFSVSREQAREVVGLFATCGANLFDSLLRSAQAQAGEEGAACLREKVRPQAYEQFLARQMSDGPVFQRSGPDGDGGADGERQRSPEQVTWSSVVSCVAPELG